jgi:hypothetical protein
MSEVISAYNFLKRGKMHDNTLLAIMFSGDMPPSFREAAEQIMLERGWLDSLLIEVRPPHRIFYMGVPGALRGR